MGATKTKDKAKPASDKTKAGGVAALRVAVLRHCEKAHVELTGDPWDSRWSSRHEHEREAPRHPTDDQAVLEAWEAFELGLRRARAIRAAREAEWEAFDAGHLPHQPRRDLAHWLCIRLAKIERSNVFNTSPPRFADPPSTPREALASSVILDTTYRMLDVGDDGDMTREAIAKRLPPLRLIAIRSLLEGNFPQSVTTRATVSSVIAAEVRVMRLAVKRALAAWRPDDLADPDGDHHRERLTFGM